MKKLFKNKKFLIGMIHLPPLLSFKNHPGINICIEKALFDLAALEKAGFDGALIENNEDQPHTEFANEAQIASMSTIAWKVMKKAKIPIGIQMMLNDWKSSITIAKAVNANFTRLDVFVDDMSCKWCNIYPNPKEIMEYKNKIYPELIMFTDIQVKHKKMIDKNKSLIESTKEAIDNKSDGLVITGNWTGQETPIENIKLVKASYPNFTVIVGAGINEDNIKNQLNIADGAIVGTSIKNGNFIDYNKAKKLISCIR